MTINGFLRFGRQWRVVPYATDAISLLVYPNLGESIFGTEISEACQPCKPRAGTTLGAHFAVASPEGPAPMMAMCLMAPGDICVIMNPSAELYKMIRRLEAQKSLKREIVK